MSHPDCSLGLLTCGTDEMSTYIKLDLVKDMISDETIDQLFLSKLQISIPYDT